MDSTERLASLTEWLLDTARSTETFVVEQAPDVARQILAWGMWNAAGTGIACLILSLVLGAVVLWLFGRARRSKIESFLEVPATLLSVVVLVCLAGAIHNVGTAVKIKVAPKVYLIEEASRMLRRL